MTGWLYFDIALLGIAAALIAANFASGSTRGLAFSILGAAAAVVAIVFNVARGLVS